MQHQSNGVEEWRPVPGFAGLYSVSRSGDVFSHRARRLLRPNPVGKGYLRANLQVNSRLTPIYIHRLVATAFLGEAPDAKAQVNHKNGQKTDNRVENLEWVTQKENAHHALITGLLQHNSVRRRLAPEQIHEIRESAYSTAQLARELGVAWTSIKKVRTHRTYREL